MTKNELVADVAQRAGVAQTEAGTVVDALLESVKENLAAGQEIALTGFGKFSVSDRPAREGRNPANGETIQIKASRVPKFSAGAQLKQAVAA